MFFGLEVKSNQSKPLVLENTTKLSQAVLEPPKNGKREVVSLIAEYNKKQFILCVLDPSLSWQCPLDLLFEGGAEVKFSLRGSGTVHLTGYEPLDDYDDMNYSISSVSSSEDEDMDLTPSKSKLAITNGAGSASHSAKKSAKVPTPSKKSKGKEVLLKDLNSDESDSDDEDFMYSSSDEDFELIKKGMESSSDEVTASDEDESDDDDDINEDDEDDDDDDDDDADDDGCQIEEMEDSD